MTRCMLGAAELLCSPPHSLKHLNKKPEYIEDWWKVVNWRAVSDHYAAAKGSAA